MHVSKKKTKKKNSKNIDKESDSIKEVITKNISFGHHLSQMVGLSLLFYIMEYLLTCKVESDPKFLAITVHPFKFLLLDNERKCINLKIKLSITFFKENLWER